MFVTHSLIPRWISKTAHITTYSSRYLKILRPAKRPEIDPGTFNTLKELDILKQYRGNRGGVSAKLTRLHRIPTVMHRRKTNICISVERQVNHSNLATVAKLHRHQTEHIPKENVPSLFLSNVMSLTPKIDELRVILESSLIDIAFITETWLKNTIDDNILNIANFNLIRKDRTQGQHGGVCIYLKNTIAFQVLPLEPTDLEVLWISLRPQRLPRGFSQLVCGVIYHPPGANENMIIDYLSNNLQFIESKYPHAAVILAGDFNHLNITEVSQQYSLTQMVNFPTRGNNTLDLVLTNLPDKYSTAEKLPALGLSDHLAIAVYPKNRPIQSNSTKIIKTRDLRESKKIALGRYLSNIDWRLVESKGTCQEMTNIFTDLVTQGVDILLPLKTMKIHHSDPPWLTQKFRLLIKKRQSALHSNHSLMYKYYRNAVNRERKKCKAKFYQGKVKELKNNNPKQWWNQIKRISGMSKPSHSPIINDLNNLQPANESPLSLQDHANAINCAFLKPMENYIPLEQSPHNMCIDPSTAYKVTKEKCYEKLINLNAHKAPGPDKLHNWILKEYAEILSQPITTILNASFLEQKLPQSWKRANVVPIPKTKMITDINSHLRPISLTPALSKVAEDFIVKDHVKPAAIKYIDGNQYGCIPNSSTTMALISMLHEWYKATDGNGATSRIVFFDFRKAFDLIDHSTLIRKLKLLQIQPNIVNWIIDFLTNREQRVKLGEDCFSEWGKIPSGVPQGTKLGPWLFIIMINDLNITNTDMWKFVDDTTISENIPKGHQSNMQTKLDQFDQWSNTNLFQPNEKKCKEMQICFRRDKTRYNDITPLNLNGKTLEVVHEFKLLGLIITDNLKWNTHISYTIKKANRRIYFIVQLKRAKVGATELIQFYCTCIRPILEYAAPVYHNSLPEYLHKSLEKVKKRVMSIIFGYDTPYIVALEKANITTLKDRREQITTNLFKTICNTSNHKLHPLLPPKNSSAHNTRNRNPFCVPGYKTNRLGNSFILANVLKSQ